MTTGTTVAPEVCTCRQMTGGVCPACQRRVVPAMSMPTLGEQIMQFAREAQPDLWARTEAVARIIDPSAFADDWIIHPESAARLHSLKLKVLQDNAMRKAQDVLTYLGVNTETDWYEILTRLAER
jgi:hypothetical protein